MPEWNRHSGGAINTVIPAKCPRIKLQIYRHVYWNGGYFGCIYTVKSLLPKPETSQAELFNNFVSGAIGGFAGTVLNTP
jgi:hypothetical protein